MPACNAWNRSASPRVVKARAVEVIGMLVVAEQDRVDRADGRFGHCGAGDFLQQHRPGPIGARLAMSASHLVIAIRYYSLLADNVRT